MNFKEKKQFIILCNTTILILNTYKQHRFIPRKSWQYWHPRGHQLAFLKKQIKSLKKKVKSETSLNDITDRLIKTLDDFRYFLGAHTTSRYLRLIVQDALIAALNFTPDDIEIYHRYVKKGRYIPAYIDHFKDHQEIQKYREYFVKRHAIFGVDVSRLSHLDLTMYAKAGVINGKLIDRFGIREIIKLNMRRVRKELQTLMRQKIEKGFLTLDKMEG